MSIRSDFKIEDTTLVKYSGKSETVVVPDFITYIEHHAFAGCGFIKSITIPNSVTSIGDGAFYDCSELTNISFQGTTKQFNDIMVGDEWDVNTGNYTIHCTDGDIDKKIF